MSSLQDITAAEVADEDPVTVNLGETLSKVRNTMEENRLRAIAVVDGHRFEGMLSYRDVMEKLRSDPTTTKVDDLVHTPPTLEGDESLVDLASLRIDSGRKGFAILGEHERLEGVIGERELVLGARDADELESVSVSDLMVRDLLTIESGERFETARKRMRDNNVSRLVVTGSGGGLEGVITSFDTLQAMVPRDQMSGGTGNKSSGMPTGSGDRKGEKESMSEIPVRELMQTSEEIDAAILRGGGSSLRNAIDTLERGESTELVVVEDGEPVGLLTLKDIIDFFASQEQVEAMRVQLTGPEVPEEKAAIHTKIENQVRGSLGRMLRDPEELTVHMKKHEKDGSQHKYSLNFKLVSELGTKTVKTHSWDLLDAVDDGLEKLEKVVKKEREKKRDESREARRKGKYSNV
ncbi:MAG: CBS domain-containing protein [Candidatus Nanohaloarchaea archaeon]|nr:CBS domain-containing protein [Candidatus Nanohaloarchaea archaeon]